MDLIEKILSLMKVFILFWSLEFFLFYVHSLYACNFNVYISERKIDCERNQFELQLCSILATCPSVYQINQILKALYQSDIIGDFTLTFSDSTTSIYINPIIKLSDIEVSGRIPADISGRLKDFIMGRRFKGENDIKNVCEDFLVQEGVFEPRCIFKISDAKAHIEVSGNIETIRDIKVSVEDESFEKNILKILRKYEQRRFFPALLQDIRKNVSYVLRKSGYMQPDINIYFESGTIYCNLKLGKKYAIFLNSDLGEKFDLYEDEIIKEIIENFTGDFSQYSLKLFLENYLKVKNIPYQVISVSEIVLDEQISAVNISIKSPKMFYLDRFRIEGLKRLDESDIKKYIGINEKNIITFFNPRHALYQEKQIDTFISRIYEFARSKGFFDFKIIDVQKKFSLDSLNVLVFVEEGDRAVIDSISFENFPEDVSKKLEIPKTPFFYDREFLKNFKSDIEMISREYTSENFEVEIYEDWKTKKLVDISFVYIGEKRADLTKYFFADSRTDHTFLKNMVDLKEGDIITLNNIEKAYDNLNGIKYFDSVNIKSYPVSLRSSERESLLVLGAYEGKLNELGVSGGLSSVEGIRGSLDFTKRNIYYWGLDLLFSISSAYWIFPFGRDIGLTFLGFRSEIIRRRLIIKSDVSLTFYPKYESTFLYNVQSPFYLSLNISREISPFKLSLSFLFNSRMIRSWQGFSGRPELPNLKNIFTISQSVYFKKSYLFASIKNDVIMPLKGVSDKLDFSLEFYRFRQLWGIGFVSSLARIFSSDILSVPVENRFFLGGSRGPRGYKEMSIYSDIFPENVQLIRKKSLNKILFMSELFSPKVSFFRSYVFFDIGSVFHDSQSLKIFRGVGPGIFLETPFGAFRFELGYGFEKKSLIVHFSFGLNRFTL